uniref:C2H2-type domain-containing protein n=1 Tax=Acrobeloides nanus TaxID=290746 RepID=A0A914C9E0_9BILA
MRKMSNPPHYNIAYTRQEYPGYRPQMAAYEQPQSPIKRTIGQMIPLSSVVPPERRRILISTEGGVPRTISTITTSQLPYIQGGPIIRRLPVGKTTVITQRSMFVETPPVANTVTVETSSSPVKSVRWEKTPSYYPPPTNFNHGDTATIDENQAHLVQVEKVKASPQKTQEKPIEAAEKTTEISQPKETTDGTVEKLTATEVQKSSEESPVPPPSKTPDVPETKKRRRKEDLVRKETEESTPEEDENDETIFKRVRIEYTDGTGGRGYQPSENEYLCPKCPAQYESRVGLTNHMKLHGTNKTHACDLCDFSCTNKKTMRHHKRAHGILFSKRQRRTRKKKEEDDKAEELAKKVDIKKETSDVRKEAHTSVKVTSQIVEKMNQVIANVVSADKQDDEQKTKKLESPSKSVKCPDCPFTTRTQARLGSHQLGHSRRSGYQCPTCTFKSESLSFLKRHMDLHEGNLPWPPSYVGGEPGKEPKEQLLKSPRKKEAQEEGERSAGPATRSRQRAIVTTPTEPERKSSRKVSPKKPEIEEKLESPKRRTQETTEQGPSKEKVEDQPTSSTTSSLVSEKTSQKRKPAAKKGEGPFHCAQCGIKLKRYGELKIHVLHFHKANRKSPEVVRRFLRERIARSITTTK